MKSLLFCLLITIFCPPSLFADEGEKVYVCPSNKYWQPKGMQAKPYTECRNYSVEEIIKEQLTNIDNHNKALSFIRAIDSAASRNLAILTYVTFNIDMLTLSQLEGLSSLVLKLPTMGLLPPPEMVLEDSSLLDAPEVREFFELADNVGGYIAKQKMLKIYFINKPMTSASIVDWMKKAHKMNESRAMGNLLEDTLKRNIKEGIEYSNIRPFLKAFLINKERADYNISQVIETYISANGGYENFSFDQIIQFASDFPQGRHGVAQSGLISRYTDYLEFHYDEYVLKFGQIEIQQVNKVLSILNGYSGKNDLLKWFIDVHSKRITPNTVAFLASKVDSGISTGGCLALYAQKRSEIDHPLTQAELMFLLRVMPEDARSYDRKIIEDLLGNN